MEPTRKRHDRHGAAPEGDTSGGGTATMTAAEFFARVLELGDDAAARAPPTDDARPGALLAPVAAVARAELAALEQRAAGLTDALARLQREPLSVGDIAAPDAERMRREARAVRARHAALARQMALQQKLALVDKLAAAVAECNAAYIAQRAQARALDAAGVAARRHAEQSRDKLTALAADEAARAAAADGSAAGRARALLERLARLESALMGSGGGDALVKAALHAPAATDSGAAQLDALAQRYAARITFDAANGRITMALLDVDVDLATGALTLRDSLPPNGFEVLRYLAAYMRAHPARFPARRVMATWHWGTRLTDALLLLPAAGRREARVGASELVIRQAVRALGVEAVVRIEGLKLTVSGVPENTADRRLQALLAVRATAVE